MTRRALAAILGFTMMAGVVAAATPHRWLYDDPVRFRQLSGAAQMLLKQKFAPARPVLPFAPQHPRTLVGNVAVNNPAADLTSHDTQSTSALALGTGSNIIGAYNDSGSFTGANNHFSGFAQSVNAGAAFTDKGVLPTSTEGDGGSPVLAADQTSGTLYLATLGFITNENIQVFRSTNNGTTFQAPVNATPGFAGTADFQDKPWIAADNFAGPGQGTAYLVWRRFPFAGNGDIRITSSTDGGATWGPTQGNVVYTLASATDQAQGPCVVVAPDHSVNVFWYDQTTAGVRTIKVKKSTDGGATFGSAITIATLATTGTNGDLGLNGGFLTNSFPRADANPVNGDLYAVYNDDPAGQDKASIFLRRSSDGGATWSAATLVNGDGTTMDQFHPSLAIMPDGSRVFVSWYDRRNDPSNNLIDRYAAIYTVDGSGNLTKDSEFRITTASFPPALNQDTYVPMGYMGDYDQSTADNNYFYTAWGDNRLSDPAHTNQPDVRFAKVAVTGPGAILDWSSQSINDSGGNNNGAVDPDECIEMSISLKNNGTGTASGISASLSTTSPEISLSQTTSSYADLAPGATGTNATPFQFATSAGFSCGDRIDFLLTVSTATDGNFQVPITIYTGAAGSTLQFDDAPVVAIPDLGTIELPLSVSGITTGINKVRISLQITHTRDSDLDVYLVGPDDTTVELTTDNGGTGANYGTNCSPQSARTTFDDAAATSITLGNPSFAGTFKPEGLLADFAGKSGTAANGTWKLRITDDSGSDTGIINCWSLFITPAACVPGPGPCGCPVISITPPTLPDGNAGVAYSQSLLASGGTGPYIFVLFSGTLPPGLALSSDGNITGTPTAPGAYNFTISAQDSLGCISAQAFSISIGCLPITLVPSSLPDGSVGTGYSQGIASSGGTPPYSYSLTAGALPPGITLSSPGLVSGTPVTSGTYNFTVTSTDTHTCTGSQAYSITTTCPTISVLPATLPDGDTSAAYNATLTGSGGAAPYSFAVTTGSLPPGLSMDSGGSISGTPSSAGTFPFTVTATDANGCTGTQGYSIAVSTCLFCDDFEDGQLSPNWTYAKPAWSESGGTLIGVPTKGKALAVASPAFAGCSACTVEAKMRTSGGAGNKVWLLAWYVDKGNYVELLMKEESNAWVMKQHAGGSILTKAKALSDILPDTDYHVLIQHDPILGSFSLKVDGVSLLTLNGAAATGTVGFQVKSTTAFFEDILVQ